MEPSTGAGEQTLAAARRVGEKEQVLATDISANIFEFAKTSARLAGLNNICTQVADGKKLNNLDTEPKDISDE